MQEPDGHAAARERRPRRAGHRPSTPPVRRFRPATTSAR
jgi:hypothetical protein